MTNLPGRRQEQRERVSRFLVAAFYYTHREKKWSLCLDRSKLNMWLPFGQTGGVTCDAWSFLKTAGKCCVCPTQYGRSCHEMVEKSARSSRTGSRWLQIHRKWETCVSLGGHWGHTSWGGGMKSLRHFTRTPQPSLGPQET